MPHPLEIVRAECEKYPEAEKAFLFGDHEIYRVKKKVFVWLGEGDAPGSTHVSVKLKDTQDMAKWGWINADFPKGKFPESLVREWIRESYRYTAPKKLLKALEAGGAEAAKAKKPAKKQKR